MIFACHGCNGQVIDGINCDDCAVVHKTKPVEKRKVYNLDLMLEAIHYLSRRVPGDPVVKNPALKKFLLED